MTKRPERPNKTVPLHHIIGCILNHRQYYPYHLVNSHSFCPMETTTTNDDSGAASDTSPRHRVGRYVFALVFLAGAVLGTTLSEMRPAFLRSPSDTFKKEAKGSSRSWTITPQQQKIHGTITPQHEKIHEWSFPASANTSNGYFYRNRSQMTYEFNSTVQFIFTVGLEGTGHHLMGIIAGRSPATQQLKSFHIWNEKVGFLQNELFSHAYNKAGRTGIWNAHCVTQSSASVLEGNIVEKLKQIEAQTKTMMAQNSTQKTIPLALNTATVATGGKKYGEVSYPNFLGACRQLNYPDLNLLYNACRKAKVDCLHVYLHRHPMEILNSVVSRGFSSNDTSSMQMYITDLRVMANQMRMHASKTLGCFGFFSEDPNDTYWVEAQKDLWAWTNASEHKRFMDSIFQKPKHLKFTNEQQFQQWLLNSDHGPYVQSWWNGHRHAIQTCRQAVKGVGI
jgi:hypothetical protein